MRFKNLDIYFSYYNNDIFVGTLYVEIIKGKETYSFEYAESYLSSGYNFIYDPNIIFAKGRQYKNDSSSIYGFISDLIPDRWGRNLILRNEIRLAKKDKRNPEPLGESDFLIRVNDISRSGAIRIKEQGKDEFINSSDSAIPKLFFINKLEEQSFNINNLDDDDLKDLFAPGSSLGGARPKAVIYDNNNELYIAKFAKKTDEYDVPAVEMVTNELASLVGIQVPVIKCIPSTINNNRSIFLVKRFDRNLDYRIGYISAMSLLGATDGDSGYYSYLDLIDLIKQFSNSPIEDSKELFKRMVFNIIIHNGDDHLRNHGFIYKEKSWQLSPAFDLNPSFNADGLSLSIDGVDRFFDLDSAINVSNKFGYSKIEAENLVSNMKKTITHNMQLLCDKYHVQTDLYKKLIHF